MMILMAWQPTYPVAIWSSCHGGWLRRRPTTGHALIFYREPAPFLRLPSVRPYSIVLTVNPDLRESGAGGHCQCPSRPPPAQHALHSPDIHTLRHTLTFIPNTHTWRWTITNLVSVNELLTVIFNVHLYPWIQLIIYRTHPCKQLDISSSLTPRFELLASLLL